MQINVINRIVAVDSNTRNKIADINIESIIAKQLSYPVFESMPPNEQDEIKRTIDNLNVEQGKLSRALRNHNITLQFSFILDAITIPFDVYMMPAFKMTGDALRTGTTQGALSGVTKMLAGTFSLPTDNMFMDESVQYQSSDIKAMYQTFFDAVKNNPREYISISSNNIKDYSLRNSGVDAIKNLCNCLSSGGGFKTIIVPRLGNASEAPKIDNSTVCLRAHGLWGQDEINNVLSSAGLKSKIAEDAQFATPQSPDYKARAELTRSASKSQSGKKEFVMFTNDGFEQINVPGYEHFYLMKLNYKNIPLTPDIEEQLRAIAPMPQDVANHPTVIQFVSKTVVNNNNNNNNQQDPDSSAVKCVCGPFLNCLFGDLKIGSFLLWLIPVILMWLLMTLLIAKWKLIFHTIPNEQLRQYTNRYSEYSWSESRDVISIDHRLYGKGTCSNRYPYNYNPGLQGNEKDGYRIQFTGRWSRYPMPIYYGGVGGLTEDIDKGNDAKKYKQKCSPLEKYYGAYSFPKLKCFIVKDKEQEKNLHNSRGKKNESNSKDLIVYPGKECQESQNTDIGTLINSVKNEEYKEFQAKNKRPYFFFGITAKQHDFFAIYSASFKVAYFIYNFAFKIWMQIGSEFWKMYGDDVPEPDVQHAKNIQEGDLAYDPDNALALRGDWYVTSTAPDNLDVTLVTVDDEELAEIKSQQGADTETDTETNTIKFLKLNEVTQMKVEDRPLFVYAGYKSAGIKFVFYLYNILTGKYEKWWETPYSKYQSGVGVPLGTGFAQNFANDFDDTENEKKLITQFLSSADGITSFANKWYLAPIGISFNNICTENSVLDSANIFTQDLFMDNKITSDPESARKIYSYYAVYNVKKSYKVEFYVPDISGNSFKWKKLEAPEGATWTAIVEQDSKTVDIVLPVVDEALNHIAYTDGDVKGEFGYSSFWLVDKDKDWYKSKKPDEIGYVVNKSTTYIASATEDATTISIELNANGLTTKKFYAAYEKLYTVEFKMIGDSYQEVPDDGIQWKTVFTAKVKAGDDVNIDKLTNADSQKFLDISLEDYMLTPIFGAQNGKKYVFSNFWSTGVGMSPENRTVSEGFFEFTTLANSTKVSGCYDLTEHEEGKEYYTKPSFKFNPEGGSDFNIDEDGVLRFYAFYLAGDVADVIFYTVSEFIQEECTYAALKFEYEGSNDFVHQVAVNDQEVPIPEEIDEKIKSVKDSEGNEIVLVGWQRVTDDKLNKNKEKTIDYFDLNKDQNKEYLNNCFCKKKEKHIEPRDLSGQKAESTDPLIYVAIYEYRFRLANVGEIRILPERFTLSENKLYLDYENATNSFQDAEFKMSAGKNWNLTIDRYSYYYDSDLKDMSQEDLGSSANNLGIRKTLPENRILNVAERNALGIARYFLSGGANMFEITIWWLENPSGYVYPLFVIAGIDNVEDYQFPTKKPDAGMVTPKTDDDTSGGGGSSSSSKNKSGRSSSSSYRQNR